MVNATVPLYMLQYNSLQVYKPHDSLTSPHEKQRSFGLDV